MISLIKLSTLLGLSGLVATPIVVGVEVSKNTQTYSNNNLYINKPNYKFQNVWNQTIKLKNSNFNMDDGTHNWTIDNNYIFDIIDFNKYYININRTNLPTNITINESAFMYDIWLKGDKIFNTDDEYDDYDNKGFNEIWEDENNKIIDSSKKFYILNSILNDRKTTFYDFFLKYYNSPNSYYYHSYHNFKLSYKDDYVKLVPRISLYMVNNIVKLKYFFYIEMYEKDGSGYNSTKSEFKFYHNNNLSTVNITLPYSTQQIRYDLFESSNRIFEDSLTFYSNESLDPADNINNFNYIQKYANDISNKFYAYLQSSQNLAKMGANSTMFSTSYDYSGLNDSSNPYFHINIDLNKSLAGLVPIKEDILNQAKYGNNNYVKIDDNTIKVKVNVKILPGDNFNGKFEQLIKILPYNSLNNTLMYFDKTKDYSIGECLILTNRNTNNYLSNSQIINLNSGNSLITQNKIGFINKYGADVSLSFALEVNGEVYNLDPIEINKIYQYGQYDINLDISNIANNIIANNNISLSYIYNANAINIVSNFTNNLIDPTNQVNLYLTNIDIQVANDQNFGEAKWIKLSETPIDSNDKDFGGNLNSNKFYGHYSTNSPFKIILPEVLVQSVDSNNTLISKYKLFINDQPISSEPSKGFEFDTGNLYRDIMNSNSDTLNGEIKIRIYEYDPSSSSENKYTKISFGLDVNMNVLKDVSNFDLKGWNDPNIEAEKEKYFDDESEYYRPYANEKTGMYFPKVAWVNAPASNSFKYDPVDENGNLLDGLNSSDADANIDVDYKTGFLAEINASSFKSGDFSASSLTGAYDISYTNNDFDFNSNIPVVYEYSFANDNYYSIPSINKTLLFQDNSVEINSNNLTQTVLKRTNSDDYTYQFSLFNKNIINPTTNEQYDLFQLYNGFVNMNNEPLFVDFWTTYHGKNLINFIQTSQPDFSLESAYELSYLETLSYWDSYIFAKTTSYTSNSLNNYNGINTLNYICEDKYKLRQLIIDDIQAKLQEWYQNNVKKELIYLGKDYKIEDFDGDLANPSPKFDAKIDELIKNYNNNDFKYLTFSVYGISNSKLSDSTTFKISNYAKFDTLDNLNPKTIRFNSNFNGDKENNKPSFDDLYLGNSKQEKIKNLILDAIDKEIDSKFKKDYVYGVDYRLSFYSNNQMSNDHLYKDINDAINNGLLANAHGLNFKNSVFVKVEGISAGNDPNKILTGNCLKTFVNDSSLNQANEEDDLTKQESSNSSSNDWIWIMSVSIAVVILITIVTTILILRHRRKKI